MKKTVKLHIPVLAILFTLISIVLALFAAMVLYPVYSMASSVGGATGQIAGIAAGKVSGAVRGVTEGISSGAEAGKAEGLSAKDVTVEIATVMDKTGSLEVLSAETVLYDDHSVGEEGKEKSETLYLIPGTAIYTVDLTNIDVENGKVENEWTVYIPSPEVTFTINEAKIKLLAEQLAYPNAGSAEAGYIASINARGMTIEKVREQMTNYDSLMEMAKGSAITQVESLAYSVCGENANIKVKFDGKEQS